jgi:zinc-ribbon domain
MSQDSAGRRELSHWAKRERAGRRADLTGSRGWPEPRAKPTSVPFALPRANQIAWRLMFCPHCGAENDDANRFCIACGSDLSKRSSATPKDPISFRERLERVFGTTARARLVSAGTTIAVVVAIVAFITLKPSKESVHEDSYLRGLDRSCVAEKGRISTLEAETLRQRPPNLAEFASTLVTIVAEWRSNLGATPPPPVNAEGARVLESALLTALIEAGALARATREDSSASVVGAQAHSVDEATTGVDRAIEGLGLERCTHIDVAP